MSPTADRPASAKRLDAAVCDAANFVKTRWKPNATPDAEFAAIAAEALRSSGIADAVSSESLAAWLGSHGEFPDQFDATSEFGNPPLTLHYDSARGFVVDVYYWIHTDASIHDHSFMGAFAQAVGTSVHTDYEYAGELLREVADGTLSPRRTMRLAPRSIVEISEGSPFIHQIAHLDLPTITAVIRTIGRTRWRQRTYLPGGLAITSAAMTAPWPVAAAKHFRALCKLAPTQAEQFVQQMAAARSADDVLAFTANLIHEGLNADVALELSATLTGTGAEASGIAAPVLLAEAARATLRREGARAQMARSAATLGYALMHGGFSAPTREFFSTTESGSSPLAAARSLFGATTRSSDSKSLFGLLSAIAETSVGIDGATRSITDCARRYGADDTMVAMANHLGAPALLDWT